MVRAGYAWQAAAFSANTFDSATNSRDGFGSLDAKVAKEKQLRCRIEFVTGPDKHFEAEDELVAKARARQLLGLKGILSVLAFKATGAKAVYCDGVKIFPKQQY